MKSFFLVLALVFSTLHSYSAIQYSNCAQINESDLDSSRIIEITQNINFNGLGSCFDIIPDNISINCQGNYIDGNQTGILFNFSTPGVKYNITYNNCNLRNSAEIIEVQSSIYNVLFNNSIINETLGIHYYTRRSVFFNNTQIIKKDFPIIQCDNYRNSNYYNGDFVNYILNSSFYIASPPTTCIQIRDFDCRGNTIDMGGGSYVIDIEEGKLQNCELPNTPGSLYGAIQIGSNSVVDNVTVYGRSGSRISSSINISITNSNFLTVSPDSRGIIFDGSSNIKLENLTVINSGLGDYGILNSVGQPTYNVSMRNIYIENFSQGISLNDNSHNYTFENITINNTNKGMYLGEMINSSIDSLSILNTNDPIDFEFMELRSEIDESLIISNSYLGNFTTIANSVSNWSDVNVSFFSNTFLENSAPENECFDSLNTTCNIFILQTQSLNSGSTASLFPISYIIPSLLIVLSFFLIP